MSATQARTARLKKALAEVLVQRQRFSDDTVREIIRLLNEKIDALETADAAELPPHEGDQIRLVSVMFVDMENSTHLAQALDEDWKPLLDELHSRVARIVDDWGGEVGQYLGDGLLCFFGAHHSRGDDAQRAVSCALAIQKMAREFAEDANHTHSEALALRVGISTGRVVVGIIGTAAKREVAAVGSTTNLAARLQHLCPPKQVLIDDETYYRIRDYFVVQPQAPVKLKGFDTPLRFYRVIASGRQPNPVNDHVAGIPLPFVGRDREVDYLLRLWQDALVERAFHTVTVYGDIGVGKSRLLHEALAHIQNSNADIYVITLSAVEDRRAGAYALLRQLLTQLCRQTDGMADLTHARVHDCVMRTWPGPDGAQAAMTMSRLIGVLSDEEDEIPLDPLETAARWLLSLAGERPFVMLVDNLSVADHTSLDLLEYIALVGVNRCGLLIGAARGDFRERRPHFMSNSARLTEITLGDLPDAAARALVEAVITHVDNPPPQLVDQTCKLAEGNVLFIEEYLRMLFDSHVFVPDGQGRWQTDSFRYRTLDAAVPQGLVGVFQARLDDLRAVARRIVQVAAVFGGTFWENAVSHLIGSPTQSMLDELVAHGLFTTDHGEGPNGQPNYRFRHTLYRDVAYRMLTRPDREAYHRRAAEWLLEWTEAAPDLLPLRAEHLVHGGQREEALAVYLTAVRSYAESSQPHAALRMIEQGLAAARDVPRPAALPVVSQLWLWQATVLVTLRRYAQASAAARSALMLMGEMPSSQFRVERARAAATLATAEQSFVGES